VTLELATSNLLPSSGSFAGDVIAIALALVTFALIYWAIDLVDRI
jgi:hypothetical protein